MVGSLADVSNVTMYSCSAMEIVGSLALKEG